MKSSGQTVGTEEAPKASLPPSDVMRSNPADPTYSNGRGWFRPCELCEAPIQNCIPLDVYSISHVAAMERTQETARPPRLMKTCPKCGSSIDKGSGWCPNCFALQSDKSA